MTNQETHHREVSDSSAPDASDVQRLLIIGCVFAIVGGYTDAYSYLAHGHVFANGQTGNVVFFGVFASGGDWGQAVRHLPPIAAFIAGVAIANLVGVQSQKREFRATLICQVFELTVLLLLIAAGKFLPDAWIVPIISFVAAIQNSSLNVIGAWSFNSAMTTGNLRTATGGLVLWLLNRNPDDNRGKAITLGLVCLSFLVGAVAGGVYTRLDENHALVPCTAAVGVGIILTWRERKRRLSGRANHARV